MFAGKRHIVNFNSSLFCGKTSSSDVTCGRISFYFHRTAEPAPTHLVAAVGIFVRVGELVAFPLPRLDLVNPPRNRQIHSVRVLTNAMVRADHVDVFPFVTPRRVLNGKFFN